VKDPVVASRKDWLEKRKQLLVKEKEFMQLRDELSSERRNLPWVQVNKSYEFEDAHGKHALSDLFGEHQQLIIYHFMMGESWEEGCPSCSLWADGFNGNAEHFAARDAAFAVVSSASAKKIQEYKNRMGWTFKWYSARHSEFNQDYHVTFAKEPTEGENLEYNYREKKFDAEELPGVSIFAKDKSGNVFHTYSTYSRGLDNLNIVYQYLDLLPKGRDEEELDFTMAWVRRRDAY